MSSIKIARQDYRRATQTDLSAFAEIVIKRTNNVPAYQGLQAQIQTLTEVLTDFQQKLIAASNRGISEVLAKKNAMAVLVDQLDIVATNLEWLAQQNEQVIVDAGFRAQQSRQVRYDLELPVPQLLNATTTGVKGQLQVALVDLAPVKMIATHAFEYSTDREHWINGTYNSHRKFKVNGLPRAQDIWVRVRSLGYGERRSGWTEPMQVAVL